MTEKHEHGGKGSGTFVNRKKVVALLIHKDDSFLDLGCGPGDYLSFANKVASKVIGADIHKESLEHVKKLGFKAVFGDATKKLPFKAGSFDSILVSNVMHGFVNDGTSKAALSEIKRALKKEGRLGIVEFKSKSPMGPLKEIRLSEKKLIDLVAPYKFKKIASSSVGMFNYMTVFVKE